MTVNEMLRSLYICRQAAERLTMVKAPERYASEATPILSLILYFDI